jgi:hypothetical protein
MLLVLEFLLKMLLEGLVVTFEGAGQAAWLDGIKV